ncbi:MAG: inosine monophosphate cyclohydrolase, partial [Clostridia bacterium]|nr:inosine monophosphate cyclohydrolase [Clostridia bacterium]
NCNKRFFFEYDNPQPGIGHFIHTYNENLNPLPAFEGEPRTVEMIEGTAQEIADVIWTNLNADNKVSLFVRTIDLKTGETETVIVNKHE